MASTSSAPDGGWGWVVVAGATIVHVFTIGLVRCSGLVYQIINDRFESSATAAAGVLSVFNSLRLLSAPVSSILCQRIGCRLVTMIGGAIFCLGLALTAVVPRLPCVYFTYSVVAACGASMTLTSALIMISAYFNKRKGCAMGMTLFGAAAGLTVLAPIFQLLNDNFGFFGTMLIMGGLMMQNIVGGAVFRPVEAKANKCCKNASDLNTTEKGSTQESEPLQQNKSDSHINASDNDIGESVLTSTDNQPEKENSDAQLMTHDVINSTKVSDNLGNTGAIDNTEVIVISSKADSETPVDSSDQEDKNSADAPVDECECDVVETQGTQSSACCNSSLVSLFLNPGFLAYSLLLIAFTMAYSGYLTFLPAHGRDLPGVTQGQVAGLLSMYGIADMVGCLAFGFLYDLRLIQGHRRFLYSSVAVFGGAASMLTPLVTSYSGLSFVVVLNALLKASLMSQRITVLSDFVPAKDMPMAIGCCLAIQGLGNIIGPPIEGLIKDSTGSYKGCFYLEGAALTSMALLCLVAFFCCSGKGANDKKDSRRSCFLFDRLNDTGDGGNVA